MTLNFLLYTAIIILYIIFFVFLFYKNIEGLVFILLFLLMTVSGYKVILDFYENRELLKVDFSQIFGPETNLISSLIFSPIMLFILLISLFILCILYSMSLASLNTIFVNVSLLAVYILFSMPSNSLSSPLQLHVLYGIPIMLLIISLIFIMVTITTLNYNSPTGRLDLPYKYRNILNTYKGTFVTSILILIASMIFLTLSKRSKTSNKNVTEGYSGDSFNYITAGSMFFIYIFSFISFNGAYDIYKLVRYNMKTLDKYKLNIQGECGGSLPESSDTIEEEASIPTDSETTGGGTVTTGIFTGLPILRQLPDNQVI